MDSPHQPAVLAPLVTATLLTTWPKRAAMLQEALASLAWQAPCGGPIEAVVVNDGEPIASRVPWVRVVNLPARVPIGTARSISYQHARGTWIAMWDDDDLALPHRLASTLAVAPPGGYARAEGFYVADAQLRIAAWVKKLADPTLVVARAALDRLEGWLDEEKLENIALEARLVLRGVPRGLVRCAGYVHRRHGSNLSVQKHDESLLRLVGMADPAVPIAPVQAALDALRRQWAGSTFVEPIR